MFLLLFAFLGSDTILWESFPHQLFSVGLVSISQWLSFSHIHGPHLKGIVQIWGKEGMENCFYYWKIKVSLVLTYSIFQFSSVQLLSHVWLYATPWITAPQASLSITNSWSLLKLMSIELVMTSNHLILCNPLLLLPSIFPRIRVLYNESALHVRWPNYWSFSFNISLPMNI